MDLSDQTIIELQSVLEAAKRGDQTAFAELLNRFEQRFQEIVRQMLWKYPRLKRWEQTDDVYQQAMIRLHRSLEAAAPETVSDWVGLSATQIRRTLIDLSRHYFGALGLGKQYHTEGGGRAADDDGGSLENNKLNTQPLSLEDWSDFHLAVEALPKDAREAFELIWYTGLKQEEASRLLDISRRTLIRRLNLARRLLSEQLS